jgi:hypothetical protein
VLLGKYSVVVSSEAAWSITMRRRNVALCATRVSSSFEKRGYVVENVPLLRPSVLMRLMECDEV